MSNGLFFRPIDHSGSGEKLSEPVFRTEQTMYYVKCLLKYAVQNQIFYEESILQIVADSFAEAYQKAESYTSQMIEPQRKNRYGDTVYCSIVDYLDCFCADDEKEEVQEVYSRFFQNHTGCAEQNLVNCLGGSCTREELLPLRYFPDQNEEQVLIQKERRCP